MYDDEMENVKILNANNKDEYLEVMEKFKKEHECIVEYRSTIKPIHYPVKIILTIENNKAECVFDY